MLADYRIHHALVPERQLESFVYGRALAIHPEERDGKFEVEVGTVVEDRLTVGVENRDVDAAGRWLGPSTVRWTCPGPSSWARSRRPTASKRCAGRFPPGIWVIMLPSRLGRGSYDSAGR